MTNSYEHMVEGTTCRLSRAFAPECNLPNVIYTLGSTSVAYCVTFVAP